MCMWVHEEPWGQHLPTSSEESGSACPTAPFPVPSHPSHKALPAAAVCGDR